MAASVALRGVRAGPGTFHFGTGTAAPVASNAGIGGFAVMASDGSMQQNTQQGASASYNGLFGMNSMHSYGTGISNSTTNSFSGTSNFVQDIGNPNTNRSLLEMGFPYQPYGTYGGMFGNNAQAMLMAQAALRSNPGAYLGFTGN